LEIARTIMETAGLCFLMTRGETGAIHARLMQPFGPEEGLALWFGAGAESRKVREVQRDERATVACELPGEGAYVTLIGRATVETDEALRRQYWRESFAAFWPAGPTHGEYALLRFEPERVELMHVEQGIAPEPFGLRPAVLIKEAGMWRLSELYP
jgi:general stress protein 26